MSAAHSLLGAFYDTQSAAHLDERAPSVFHHGPEPKSRPFIEDMAFQNAYMGTFLSTANTTTGGMVKFRIPSNNFAYLGKSILEWVLAAGTTGGGSVAAYDQFLAFNLVRAYQWTYNGVNVFSGTTLDLKYLYDRWSTQRKTDEAERLRGPLPLLQRALDWSGGVTCYTEIPSPWNAKIWPLPMTLANDLELTITIPPISECIVQIGGTPISTPSVTFTTQRLWYSYIHAPTHEKGESHAMSLTAAGPDKPYAGIIRPSRPVLVATQTNTLVNGTNTVDIQLRGFANAHVDDFCLVIRESGDLAALNYHAHNYRGDSLDPDVVVASYGLIESNGNVLRSSLVPALRKMRHYESHMLSSSATNNFYLQIGLAPEHDKAYTGGLPLSSFQDPVFRVVLTSTGAQTMQFDLLMQTVNHIQVANASIRQVLA